jgi:hypothetical protein
MRKVLGYIVILTMILSFVACSKPAPVAAPETNAPEANTVAATPAPEANVPATPVTEPAKTPAPVKK